METTMTILCAAAYVSVIAAYCLCRYADGALKDAQLLEKISHQRVNDCREMAYQRNFAIEEAEAWRGKYYAIQSAEAKRGPVANPHWAGTTFNPKFSRLELPVQPRGSNGRFVKREGR